MYARDFVKTPSTATPFNTTPPVTNVPRHSPIYWLLLLSVSFWTLGELSLGQENPIPAENEKPPQAIDQPDANVERQANARMSAERRRKAMAGLAAISGIVILGVGSIVIIMLWARRLRRLARDMGPPQTTAGNDFWFLKPPKPIVSELGVGENHRPALPPATTDSPDSSE